MTLPPKPQRSPAIAKRSGRRDPQTRGVNPPEIWISIPSTSFYGHTRARARIQVRKGCYQYLTWRDGKKKREFYLGKKENRTPQRSSPAERTSPAPRSGAGPRKRGKKGAVTLSSSGSSRSGGRRS